VSQDILEAALQGLEASKAKLLEQIAAINTLIGARLAKGPRRRAAVVEDSEATKATTKKARKKGKRNLSPEARERIALLQQKRWAAYRGETVQSFR
jgi:hypothetical protein